MTSKLKDTIKRAAWTAAQAGAAAFTMLAPGIWQAPNLSQARAAAVAAGTAAIAAALSALKNSLVPQDSSIR